MNKTSEKIFEPLPKQDMDSGIKAMKLGNI